MRIRDLEPRDIPILEEWHKQSGFDYPFPYLTAKIFETVRVLVDEEDRPVQVAATKKTVEAYLLIDPTWRNPRWRLEAFMQLHEDMRGQLEARGYEDAFCVLPPQVERSFGKRLARIFGWTKGCWQHYSRKVTQ